MFDYLQTQFSEPLEMQGRIWEAGEATDNGSVFTRWEAEGFEVKFRGGLIMVPCVCLPWSLNELRRNCSGRIGGVI